MILTLYSLVIYLIFIIQIFLGILVGYLVLLTFASTQAERQTRLQPGQPTKRFVLLIPAHNEERLLPGLLNSLACLDYPAQLFEIHVVADNCTDQTAALAQSSGVNVHVRTDLTNRGKGPAIQWLFDRVWHTGAKIDAALILDADSIVNGNFLRIMAAHLENGEKVIQAYYAVRDPGSSWSSSLRYTAFALLHYSRPLARMVLGGSVGLKGNGMVFTTAIFERYKWSASITEDIELHMKLLLDGERVTFAPDAVVLGEMPGTLANSESQHDRWERGRLEMRRRYVPQLAKRCLAEISAGHFRKAYLFFDAMMEHIIPPFSVLVGVNLLCLLADLILLALVGMKGSEAILSTSYNLVWVNLWLSLLLLLGQAVYVVTGLKSVQAASNIYLGLLYTPAYMIWKFLQYGRVLFQRGELEWVRTKRNGG